VTCLRWAVDALLAERTGVLRIGDRVVFAGAERWL
jgi:hypothetical protein